MKYCSVEKCDSKSYLSQLKQTFFGVKESWLSLNPLGWKPHKTKYVCMNHFRKEDILGTTKLPFVKKGAIPQIFQNCNYDIPW